MGLAMFLATAAAVAANIAPVADVASVPATTVALVAAAPLSADPVLVQAKLSRPLVYIDAPAVAIAQAERDYSIHAVPRTERAAKFIPALERAPAEPAWSPTLASMEVGRSRPRKVGRGPLGGVFAFRVSDRDLEPSLGGIAGALWKMSERNR